MEKGNCKTSFEYECKGQEGCSFKTKHYENKDWCGKNYEGYCTCEKAQSQSRVDFMKRFTPERRLLTDWSSEQGCEVKRSVKRILLANSFYEKSFGQIRSGVDYLFADFNIYADVEIFNGEVTFDLVISSDSENIAVHMDLDQDGVDALEWMQSSVEDILISQDMDSLKEMHEDKPWE